jgi:ferrous-iron efflux pump FieF
MLTLARAHAIAHEIEDEIREAFPGAEVLIHQEPDDVKDERLDDLIEGNGKGG